MYRIFFYVDNDVEDLSEKEFLQGKEDHKKYVKFFN